VARKADKTQNVRPEAEEGTLRFDVDSALLVQLGEELVAKRSVAVAELVKNAYDADARHVIVRFEDVEEKGGEITILDDGTGIPFDRLRGTWLRIATMDKQQRPVSPQYGRPRAGSKGIGRFATRRLADALDIETTAWVDSDDESRGKETCALKINWQEFTPGSDVQSVPVLYRRLAARADSQTGTLLRLLNVRDAWAEEDVRALRNDLVRLISPIAGEAQKRPRAKESDPGFDVDLEFAGEQFKELTGRLSDEFLESAYALLSGHLDADGQATYRVQFRDEKSPHELCAKAARYPTVGETDFVVRFFVYRPEYFAGMDFNVRSAQRVGRERGGVQVHYDRFRVAPYGDVDDDWLGLDYDRGRRQTSFPGAPPELRRLLRRSDREALLIPGTNQVFGQVQLSRFRNPNIRQLANREGLQDNDAFRQMRDFVRQGINWLTVMYARHSAEKRREEREAKAAAATSPRATLSRARELIADLPEVVSEERRKEASQAIELALEAIEEQEAEHIGELQMLRVLASTGTMVVVFQHQVKGILSGLWRSYQVLSDYSGQLPEDAREEFDAALGHLRGRIEDAEHQGKLLGLLLGTKARRRRRRLAVRPIVEEVFDAFRRWAEENGVQFENGVPPALRTPPIFECELNAILINLLTNALKAVKMQAAKRIQVSAEREDGAVVLRMQDTGVGANREKWHDYFRPFVSDSEPDPVLGAGTGLGLKIVADFVDVYGGTARFVEPSSPWATCIEVRLPE